MTDTEPSRDRVPDELIPPGAVVRDDDANSESPSFAAPSRGGQSMFWQVVWFHPRFLRYLLRVTIARDLSFGWKLRTFLALCYVISPVDLVPELVLGPLGLFDDLAITLVVFSDLFQRIPDQVFARAWGRGAPFARKVGSILEKMSYVVPGPIRAGLRAVLGSPAKALPGGDAPLDTLRGDAGS